MRLEKEEYRIDCYADQLDQVAQNMPDDPEFGQTRSILSDTASKLSQVVENRASTSLRPVTLSSGDGSNRGSSRTVKAVETAQLSAAYAEAEKILEEAETLLLRASEASSRRKLAYAQVAETVGSTKVLLRST